jgi:hypothetical protein
MTAFDLRCKLDELVAARKLDRFEVYGKVTLLTGLLLPRVNAANPGTPEQAEKLRAAIAKVLGVQV